MTSIGKVKELSREFNFEWEINDFFALPKEEIKFYLSSFFVFAGESWLLRIYPNYQSNKDSIGYIGAYLHRVLPGSPIHLIWSCGLKTSNGKKEHVNRHAHVFEKAEGFGNPKLLKRKTLLERKSELVPSDTLTIVCNIEYYYFKSSGDVASVECSHCKREFYKECISSHEQKCLDKPMTCPTCKDIVALRNWFDHECQIAEVKATEKLINDLGEISLREDHSDVTIKVKDEEFRLHRIILAGRNLFFNSMFKADMKEKVTGIVSIDDCEPNIFRSFIHFVYTGKVDELSVENVCDLYKVTDKYQEDQLKAECLCFMKNKISVEKFCSFIVLALEHGEKDLLQKATDLFCKKTKEIMLSVKWQTFLREYPTQANELFLKVLDYNSAK